VRNKLFLFDIDGTIISPGNVARKLLDKIVLDSFKQSPNLHYDDVAGSTDPIIVETALLRIGEKEPLSQSINFVLNLYQNELKEVFNSSKAPFVYDDSIQLLNKIKNDGHFFGLLSGNIKKAAKIKLSKFNLWSQFPFGVFGEDAGNRDDLVWAAREKAWDVLQESFQFEDIILIGDTVADADAASVNGAKSIIVCRIPDKKTQLEKSNATIIVDDLSKVELNDVL
jgi:phosphoglycolate phosphatase-like HAD superfamily hydrolase|tara:strand:+ start:4226 stop:4903 length:678 start_codon:yes stop_codon:yes gene_type:complete